MINKIKKISWIMTLILLILLINPKNISSASATFDFSNSNSMDNVSLYAGELIELLTGDEAIESEEDYYRYEGAILKYDEKVPSIKVVTTLENSKLTIIANQYEYNDVNGNKVVWVPNYVELDGTKVNFNYSNGEYQCIINNVSNSQERIKIYYKTVFSLDKSKVNNLINGAYNTAEYYVVNDVVKKEEEKYQVAYQKYQNDLVKYDEYLKSVEKYNQEMVVYNNYLNEVKLYNEKMEKYNLYLQELEEYYDEVNLYNNYLEALKKYDSDFIAYQNYLIEKKKYEETNSEYFKEYEKYLKEMKYVEYGLSVMNLITTSMTSMSRDLYSAIMGDSVTQVLSRKDELYQVGVDNVVIATAETATYRLREIFDVYYNLNTDQEKYAYYKSNYTTIKNNLVDLLQSLEDLYGYTIVRSVIDYFGKKEQYLILIAQLVLVCNAISKGKVSNYDGNYYFDSSWTIDGRTMDDVLQGDYDFVDEESLNFPIIPSYPEAPVGPDPLPEVKEPVKPTAISKPVMPAEVVKPVAPDKMSEPTKPAFVIKPTEPSRYVLDSVTASLIDDYRSGKLRKRTEFSKNVEIEFETSFNKNFRNLQEVTIMFYDLNDTLITTSTTDYGSHISFNGTLPVKEGDNIYSSYKFSHWEYEDGTVLDMKNVTKEGIVYPKYVGGEIKTYTVTWVISDEKVVETYDYGTLPEYKEEVIGSYKGNKYFEFIGWDKEIVDVTNDITYNATFEEKYLIENENGFAEIVYSDELVTIDFSNLKTNEVNISNFFEIVVNKNSSFKLKLINENMNLIIPNSVVISLYNNNVGTLNIEIEEINDFEYNFNVKFLNEDKDEIIIKNEISASFNGTFNNINSSIYYLNDNGQEIETRGVITTSNITINNFYLNTLYKVYPLYKIVVESTDFVNVELEKTTAKYNELIKLNLELLKEGTYINSIIIVDSDNNQIKLDGTNEFTMPQSDIHIIISCEYYKYKIEFVVGEDVVSSKTYKYGEEVVLPIDPIKATDNVYSYTFIGWDKEITVVTEDKVYTAMFDKVPVEQPYVPSGPSAMKIVKVVGISGLGVGAIYLVLRILKKKKIWIFK